MAVTLTAAELAAALGGAVPPAAGDVATLLAAATSLVESFAPDAPDAIHDEAAIRLAAMLWRQTPGIRSETVGSIAVHFDARGGQNPLRGSGASALLAPYRAHGAGLV